MRCVDCDINLRINTEFYNTNCRECILNEVDVLIDTISHSHENDINWIYALIINAPWYKTLKQEFSNQPVNHETYEHICRHLEMVNNPNAKIVLSWNNSSFHKEKAICLLKYIKDNI